MEHSTRPGKLSRREFAKRLALGAIVVGFDPLSSAWVTAAQAADDPDFEKLPPLDGTLHLDEATRDQYARDYGQIIHEQPRAVLKPGSIEDIRRMVKFARRQELGIAARGQGHLPYGQAQVQNGVVIDMRSLNSVHKLSNDHVEVDAGIRWRELVQATLAAGLTPPVLPSYLGLTVGGTLSIGGISPATYRHGAQVDNVLELEVVTGEGNVLRCSERSHQALFEAALAGQGQVAIITRAVVRLAAAPAMVREYVLPYADLATLMADGARLAEDGRFDGFSSYLVPSPDGTWRFFLIAAANWTAPREPDTAALLAGLNFVPGTQQAGDAPYAQYSDSIPDVPFGKSRPDLSILIPGSAALSFTEQLLPRLTPGDLGTGDIIQLFFWKRSRFKRPLFRVPSEKTCVGLVILRSPSSEPAVVERMLAGNRALFEQNRALGGTHYPFSAIKLSRRDWQRHYAEQWDRLVRAKQRHDPDDVFASGPDIFRNR